MVWEIGRMTFVAAMEYSLCQNELYDSDDDSYAKCLVFLTICPTHFNKHCTKLGSSQYLRLFCIGYCLNEEEQVIHLMLWALCRSKTYFSYQYFN